MMSAYPQLIPQPTSTLVVISRGCHKKFALTSANGNQVLYYILVPSVFSRKNYSCSWSAVFHAGDNPKYHPLSETPVVGRCKRTTLWKRIFIEYGGSVQRDAKRDEKTAKIKSLKRSNRLRKLFCMGQKELVWSEEEEAATTEDEKVGEMNVFEMKRMGHRNYQFSIDGKNYRWTGTKMHAGGFINKLGLKGVSFHVKLVRMDDHKLVASFEKIHFRKGGKFGKLNIYADENEATLDELLIVQTAFCMVKSEKEKRDKVRDFLKGAGNAASYS